MTRPAAHCITPKHMPSVRARRPTTVGDILHDAASALRGVGIATAVLDAQVLLSHALGCTRTSLVSDMRARVAVDAQLRFQATIGERIAFRPVAQIVGAKGFWSRTVRVNGDVLTPRPETEGIVERALMSFPRHEPLDILDMCTGSGCIAAALAAEFKRARIAAADISPTALAVARDNLAFAGTRVEFLEGNLFEVFGSRVTYHVSRIFDLIVANPPYISSAELASLPPDVRLYEPPIALDGGADGLAILAQIADDAPRYLKPGGVLIMEMGMGQAAAVHKMLTASAYFDSIIVDRDLAGIDRVIAARKAVTRDR